MMYVNIGNRRDVDEVNCKTIVAFVMRPRIVSFVVVVVEIVSCYPSSQQLYWVVFFVIITRTSNLYYSDVYD